MKERLFENIQQLAPFSESELQLISEAFHRTDLAKGDFLLRDTEVCDFVGFIAEGCIRHFHVQDGEENTCYFSFENQWIADIKSRSTGAIASNNFQAIRPCTTFLIHQDRLQKLLLDCPNFAAIERTLMERAAIIATELSTILAIPKPEDRYLQFLDYAPQTVQSVPQKYVASMLGIRPESLSRIRRRLASKS